MIKKGINPEPGKIDELVGEYQITPANFFAQAATGSGCDNMGASQFLYSVNMRPVVDL